MAKQGTKIEKVCGVKKVNKMSKEVCQKELARLDKFGDFNSKYSQEIKARLAILA